VLGLLEQGIATVMPFPSEQAKNEEPLDSLMLAPLSLRLPVTQ
jgi:hypothetical protein